MVRTQVSAGTHAVLQSPILALLILSVASGMALGEDLPQLTVRFWRGNRADRLVDAALSPDGRYAAIVSSVPKLSLVRISDGEVVGHEEYGDYGGLRFSAEGSKILNCLEPMRVYDGQTLKLLSRGKGPVWPGTVGLTYEERNGKILVKEVLPDSPAARSGKIKVGDELLAFAEGPEPEKGRVDFDNEWKSVIGWSLSELEVFTEVAPGTVVRVKIVPRGKLQPQEILLERVGRRVGKDGKEGWARLNSADGQRLAGVTERGVLVLRHSPTGLVLGGIRPVNINPRGVWIFSDDGSMIAIAGPYRGQNGGLGLEVHSLHDASVLASAEIPGPSAWCGTFTPDGKQLAIGTQDSIEFFDLSEKRWVRQIPLFEGGKRDEGVATRRRVAAGFGLEGDSFFESGPTTIFVKAAKVKRMRISTGGLIAAGGGNGVMRLLDLETGKILHEIKPVDEEGEVERVDFTPDGNRLLYFSRGNLHIVDVSTVTVERTAERGEP